MLLVPYRLNTLYHCYPIANWILCAATTLISLWATFGQGDWIYPLILDGWSPFGLVGHLFLHNGISHLAGNLIFLWVFGNAICANTNNFLYPLLYLTFGILAATVHNLFDGAPAVGASGAINGIVGMATAMYPINRVSIFWLFIFKAGKFEAPLWTMSLLWLCFDLFGVVFGSTDTAVWAHIGGFSAGLIIGIVLLRTGLVTLSVYDNRSLDQILLGND